MIEVLLPSKTDLAMHSPHLQANAVSDKILDLRLCNYKVSACTDCQLDQHIFPFCIQPLCDKSNHPMLSRCGLKAIPFPVFLLST